MIDSLPRETTAEWLECRSGNRQTRTEAPPLHDRFSNIIEWLEDNLHIAH